ncbi:hypothetical protein Ahy_A06g026557 [Arachis hypogaea]|uniref:Peptidase A2 domain-containing protein n=1 Tax=Arachis hypogaea TaxID=3818 RepID=A0A445CKT0_ARAHY|nr:hypothetical protein Ahy_A06g026557 [Arachis hypogaea]
MVGTISIIPTEYLGECKSNLDEDYDQEDEDAFSFIRIEDEPSFFPSPTERQMSHLHPLHIVAVVNGFKINKVWIDGGAAISLLPERMLGKVRKHVDKLVLTNIVVTDFKGLSVKLRYLDMPFEPTETYNMSRTVDLIAEAHCVENKSCDDLIKDQVSTLSHHAIYFTFDWSNLIGGFDIASLVIAGTGTEVKSSKVALVGVVETFDVPGLDPRGVWRLAWGEGSGCNSGGVSKTLDREESELLDDLVRMTQVYEFLLKNAAGDLPWNQSLALIEKQVEKQLELVE